MIDVHYASLTSQGVQHRVFYLDGHPSRYQPRPTGLNFGEQTGTGVFPLVIAVPRKRSNGQQGTKLSRTHDEIQITIEPVGKLTYDDRKSGKWGANRRQTGGNEKK